MYDIRKNLLFPLSSSNHGCFGRFLGTPIPLILDVIVCAPKRKSGSGREAVACYLGLTWSRDDSYDVVDSSMLEWHNAAAEIAMELNPERPEVIWRDYQYQESP